MRTLSVRTPSSVRTPTPPFHSFTLLCNMVQLQEPEVDDIIGFMDGVSFLSECTDERIEQNNFYCGYDCDTTINNVFAFGPDGKVFFAAINFPGSWADGALMAHFLAHIKPRIGSYKICVDQGFPQSGDAYGTLVGILLATITSSPLSVFVESESSSFAIEPAIEVRSLFLFDEFFVF